MQVLIANPAFRRDVGGGLERYMLGSGMRFPWSLLKRKEERPRYAMFPLFLAYAAALLEKDGFTVKVIDAVPLNVGEEEFLRRVQEVNPAVILFEPNAAVVEDLLLLITKIRKVVSAKFVLAGTHATATVSELMEQYEVVDYVVVGEYELAFLELMRTLRDKGSVEDLKGIAYRNVIGDIVQSGRTEPIAPLDALPMPARHMFPAYFDTDMSVYRDGFCQHSPAYHMHTSRGCPFQCNFCDRIQVLFADNKQRLFSPTRIVDEMLVVAAAGAREIYFDDDNFTANKTHVGQICEEIIRRNVNIPWSAMCDAMILNAPFLEKMVQAGCIGIKFGLDSADARVLSAINKPLKLKTLESIVDKAKSLKIKTHMSVVLGLTGETRETLHKTFDYACDIDIDSIQFSLATPLPGTSMYEDLKESGLSSRKWSDLDGANRTVVLYEDISQEYLEAFMANSHSHWLRAKFKDPRWLFRQSRFLARTAKSQGLPGLYKRLIRAVTLLRGDAMMVREAENTKVMRF